MRDDKRILEALHLARRCAEETLRELSLVLSELSTTAFASPLGRSANPIPPPAHGVTYHHPEILPDAEIPIPLPTVIVYL